MEFSVVKSKQYDSDDPMTLSKKRNINSSRTCLQIKQLKRVGSDRKLALKVFEPE